MRTLQQVQQELPTSAEAGLSPEAVEVSRQRFGANKLTPLPREPLWRKFLEKFDEPIIKILLGAALLSMFVELFQHAPIAAGIALAVVAAALAGLFGLHRSEWVPTLLFGSALVLFFVGLAGGHPSVEGLAVMVAVILATGVAFASEYKSDREFEVLNAHKDAVHVKVIRGGSVHAVSLDDIVVGDVVSLETGDEIPGDGRLLKAIELYVDQSLMTGESEPVRKRVSAVDDVAEGPDQPGCLYRGTQIIDGSGVMLVADVGDATMLGQIARRLSGGEDEEEEAGADTEEKRVKHKLTISKELTPLQVKLKDLAELISKVGYLAAGLIFAALLVRGLFFTTPAEVFWPHGTEDVLTVSRNLLSYFVYMVIIIVVAVPEGLPMSVTVSLALAMQKMTRANSLVRQLVACETIGSATVICSDKTGTLTQNRMQVVRAFLGGRAFEGTIDDDTLLVGSPDAQTARPGSPLDLMLPNAAVNSTANLENKNGKQVVVGNSTEGALLLWLESGAGFRPSQGALDYRKWRHQFPVLFQTPFSSERKRMTTVVRTPAGLVALVKGAPEMILDLSTQFVGEEGSVQPWTDEAKQAAQAWLQDSAGRAMRTLAFAHAVLPADTPADEVGLAERRDSLEKGLVFDGCVAIRDPLREDVKAAVDRCRSAGIEVKMITGDNVETARAIACDLGLIDRRDAPIDTDDAVVLTSPRFNADHARLVALRALTQPSAAEAQEQEAIVKRLAGLRVLARARPLDKYKMVELLQGQNQVVAMTGDGTNDAPSLKKADVGLAMGIAGTEVAKEASKIVLLDDSFATIVKAVHWGRSLYENIQRFIQFQLTINVSALTIAFLGPFLGVKPPFTVLQLLWINVIMDTFAAIALCSEPPREGVMKLPPKRKDESILTRSMLQTIFGTGAFFVVVMLALLLGMKYGGWFAEGSGPDPEGWDFKPLKVRQVSIFFSVYIFFQVWNQINSRALTPEASGFAGLLQNRTFLVIVGLVAVGQVLLTSLPPLAYIFKVEPLGWLDWLGILAFTSTVLVFAEVWRRVRLATAGR
jgi:Ca2+-transporting ATPase